MSAIALTISRDEDHIMNEWIVHNLNIGFDHIYIFDDQSTNPIVNLIKMLPKVYSQKVTVLRLESGVDFFDNEQFKFTKFYDEKLYQYYGNWKQHYFNNWFLKNIKVDSEWCYFGDCDEFLYLKNHDDINLLIDDYSDFDSLYIPFIIYGTSFHIDHPEGLVTKNFQYHQNKYAPYGKSICKLNKVKLFENPHTVQREGSAWYEAEKLNTKVFDWNEKIFDLPVHLNHYMTCSVKTFISRKLRQEIGLNKGTSKPLDKIMNLIHTKYSYTNGVKSEIMNKYAGNFPSYMDKYNTYSNEKVDLNTKLTTEINLISEKGETLDILREVLNSKDVFYIPKNIN